ncbi:MAG: hypothetical protein IKD43_02080 [Clostridia bacterium]|nr:hypothetical protein [Clostridia bacterium]
MNANLLYELRIRADKPLSANLAGEFIYLGAEGVCGRESALRPTRMEVEDTLMAACDYSVYAVENQLRGGFVTAACGERIGIAGTFVYEKGAVHSVRDVTSLCVRIPHEMRGCAGEIYARCLQNRLLSLLILAPPGEGKTTILRDLCRLVSERTDFNLLIRDERGELSAGELGATADVIRFADKLTAFTAGIRAMRPDIIVTDELLPEDYAAVKRAVDSGICVFASAHLKRFDDVPEKLFQRYVILDGLGRVGRVLNEEGDDVD